jgi:hypothetical protein
MKRILVLALLAVVFAAPQLACAVGPGDTPPTSTDTQQRRLSRSGFGGISETTITGLVVDQSGQPLLDVSVKLYMGGLLVDEQLTSSDGGFEFTELIDYGNDITIDLWFVPPTDELVMENVLLKESTAAREYGLYSDCVPRTRLDPITDVIIKLYTLDERIEVIKRRDCIG